MEDDRYNPDNLIASYPTAGGTLEIYKGTWYRHVVTQLPVSMSKVVPKTLPLFAEEVSDGSQE